MQTSSWANWSVKFSFMHPLSLFTTKVISMIAYFNLWPHSELELNNFFLAMNSFHSSIIFTSEIIYNKITFLDISFYKGPNIITSKKLDVELI